MPGNVVVYIHVLQYYIKSTYIQYASGETSTLFRSSKFCVKLTMVNDITNNYNYNSMYTCMYITKWQQNVKLSRDINSPFSFVL